MSETILILHIFIAIAMVILVLLQRSEGGALGIGGGAGGHNMFSGRGVAGTLVRLTAGLAILFFITSIGLTVLSTMEGRKSVLDDYIAPSERGVIEAPAPALPTDMPPILPDAAPDAPPSAPPAIPFPE